MYNVDYIKNGIAWFDMTDYDWVYENEYFVPGHEYQVRVYLKTEDGYTFYHDKWLEMLFTASINGTVASGNTTTSWGLTEQNISVSFNCKGKEITTVMVNGLATPKAGETPDYSANAAYPEWYQLDANYGGTGGIIWYDSEGNQMEPTDKFISGKQYKVEIKLISATLNGANTSQFVSPVSAYVNGKQVVANDDWDMVYGNSNVVYIYYTFTKGATAPDANYGDANGDGKVNNRDLVRLQQHLAEWDVEIVEDNSDVDGNGKVNNRDLVRLQQYLAEWDVTLGPNS